MSGLEKASPCKVNLLLNILSKRPDGFHELETVMHPVDLFDRITLRRAGQGIELTCNVPGLPVDATNLVYRAAAAFLGKAGIADGLRLHLEKHVPLAAGLGGGSGNAAVTLSGLNELFGVPLGPEVMRELAAALGSDVPFFLQDKPALATGRGEVIQPLDWFPALAGKAFLLIYPGFGVPTAWAYRALSKSRGVLPGQPRRAERLIRLLNTTDLRTASAEFFNSLESPVLSKYPLLALYQEFLRAEGAPVTLMSGSGSTTFAILDSEAQARAVEGRVRHQFESCWTYVAPIMRS